MILLDNWKIIFRNNTAKWQYTYTLIECIIGYKVFFLLVQYWIQSFFLKRLKWNIYYHIKALFPAQGVPRNKRKVWTIFTKGTTIARKISKWKKLLSYAQYGERIKPPAMQIEGKSNVLRLHPHIGDGLNPLHHLKNGALFACKYLLLYSFQIFQTVANNITCKIERRFLPRPPLKPNWWKWLGT